MCSKKGTHCSAGKRTFYRSFLGEFISELHKNLDKYYMDEMDGTREMEFVAKGTESKRNC